MRNPGLPRIAIFGGTFDPVHFGHLRSAVEIREALHISTLKVIPSRIPPHRDSPTSTPAQRLDMLRLAVDGVAGIEIDTREIEREGKSYAVETLSSIRRELGDTTSLTMVIGRDQFCVLDEWHDWRDMFELAHVAVMDRPGCEKREPHPEVVSETQARLVNDGGCLGASPAGLVCSLRMTQLDISSTAIRRMVREGRSAKYLLPDRVIDYIHANGLYRDVGQ